MSNFEPLSAQRDWQEHSPPITLNREQSKIQSSVGQPVTLITSDKQSQRLSIVKPPLEHRHSLGQWGQGTHLTPLIKRPDSTPSNCGSLANNFTAGDGSLVSVGSTEDSFGSLGSDRLSSASSATVQRRAIVSGEDNNINLKLKKEDEEEEDIDDDEMLNIEERAAPQTAAEDRAGKRKMKRFRLTHQQTRFLVNEFTKQAHPDAAYRERLSQEIPGLSSRQVQVWFQNRRAKIKRLTADNGERMMKMRLVPYSFDNVQALHSQYRPIHGIGTLVRLPGDSIPTYSDNMMKAPLMADRMPIVENEEYVSLAGTSPAFCNGGFVPQDSMGSDNVLSSISPSLSDRYHINQFSSPLSASARNSNPFQPQNSYQPLTNVDDYTRSLQPLQIRKTIPRTRSDLVRSPSKSSVPWKGEPLDYATYQTGQHSPQLSGRQESLYQPNQVGLHSINGHQYDESTYSNLNIHSTPTTMPYLASRGGLLSSLRTSSPPVMSRHRFTAESLPPGIDLRNEHQSIVNDHGTSTPEGSSFAAAFTDDYAGAPLVAPIDISLPRDPKDTNYTHINFDFAHLSTPMIPPAGISNAYNSNLDPNQEQQGEEFYANPGRKSGQLEAHLQGQNVQGSQQLRQHIGSNG